MADELRDLRWAIAASQHRSLRQAAETLNVRQSTLSRRMRELEHRLGAVLFERTTGGTRPTTAGQEFLDAARRIVSDVDAAFAGLMARSRGESGGLTVGVCAALSTGNLRATLMEHQRRFPNVDIKGVDGRRVRLLSDLSADAIDVAIMTAGSAAWADKALPLWSERVVVAVPEGHPLYDHEIIQWTELEGENILVTERDPGPDYERLLLSKLGSQGECRLMRHKLGIERLLSFVGAGLGLTLAAEGATGAAYPGLAYRAVQDGDGPTRLSFVAYWREANANPTLAPFLDMLRERYPDLSAPGTLAEED